MNKEYAENTKLVTRTDVRKSGALSFSGMKILGIFLLIIVLFSVACAQQKKEDREIVVYLPKTISSVPLLELEKKAVNGYVIKTVFFQDHIMALAEFLTGKCDLFYTGTSQGAAHYLNDPSVVDCATIVWGTSSLIALKPELKTLAGFAGRKIAVPFAKSPLDLQLRAILAKTPDLSVSLEYIPLQQAVPMLLNNQVDGICLPEPQASMVIIKNNAHEVFYFPDEWARVMNTDRRTPQVSLFAKKGFVKGNIMLLKDLVRSIKKEMPYSVKQAETLGAKYAETFGIDPALLIKALQKTLFDIPDSGNSIELTKAYLKQTGFDPGPDDGFYFGY